MLHQVQTKVNILLILRVVQQVNLLPAVFILAGVQVRIQPSAANQAATQVQHQLPDHLALQRFDPGHYQVLQLHPVLNLRLHQVLDVLINQERICHLYLVPNLCRKPALNLIILWNQVGPKLFEDAEDYLELKEE